MGWKRELLFLPPLRLPVLPLAGTQRPHLVLHPLVQLRLLLLLPPQRTGHLEKLNEPGCAFRLAAETTDLVLELRALLLQLPDLPLEVVRGEGIGAESLNRLMRFAEFRLELFVLAVHIVDLAVELHLLGDLNAEEEAGEVRAFLELVRGRGGSEWVS